MEAVITIDAQAILLIADQLRNKLGGKLPGPDCEVAIGSDGAWIRENGSAQAEQLCTLGTRAAVAGWREKTWRGEPVMGPLHDVAGL